MYSYLLGYLHGTRSAGLGDTMHNGLPPPTLQHPVPIRLETAWLSEISQDYDDHCMQTKKKKKKAEASPWRLLNVGDPLAAYNNINAAICLILQP